MSRETTSMSLPPTERPSSSWSLRNIVRNFFQDDHSEPNIEAGDEIMTAPSFGFDTEFGYESEVSSSATPQVGTIKEDGNPLLYKS